MLGLTGSWKKRMCFWCFFLNFTYIILRTTAETKFDRKARYLSCDTLKAWTCPPNNKIVWFESFGRQMDDLCHCSFFTEFWGLLVTMVTRLNTDTQIVKKTFPNMDLDLSTYVFHYDKEKNSSLNHRFFEVMADSKKVSATFLWTKIDFHNQVALSAWYHDYPDFVKSAPSPLLQ